MRFNKYFSRALSGALGLTVLVSGVGVASYSAGAESAAPATTAEKQPQNKSEAVAKNAANALEKTETVYVIAKADGTPEKVIVSDWIKNTGKADKITDKSNLTDIENVKGDEGYTIDEKKMVQWDAKGNDIYYQGKGNASTLPVGVSVKYMLDGKPVSAEELKGKSGKVTIRFDYTNRQFETVKINGKDEKIYVPFAMLTGMLLDNDKFRNVEVTNGKVINDGSRTYVAGFAFPGMQESLGLDKKEMELPTYVEVTAEVQEFELATTMTVATADLFGDLDTEKADKKLDDLDKKLDEFTSAVDKLADGTSQLYEGVGTLLSKSGELTSGVSQLYDGAASLKDGTAQLSQGADDLSKGAKQLDSGAGDLKTGAVQLDSGMGELFSGAGTLDNGVAQLQGYISQLAGGLSTISSNSAQLQGGARQVFDTLLAEANKQIAAAGLEAPALTVENYQNVLDQLIAGLSDESVQALAEQKAQAAVSAQVNAQRDMIRQAVEGAARKQVTEGVLSAAGVGMTLEQYDAAVAAGQVPDEVQAQITTAVASQMTGMESMLEAKTDEQVQALIDQNMQSEEVQAQIAQALAQAQGGRQSLQALKAQLDSYSAFYYGVYEYTAGVDSANAGAQEILGGTYTLKSGSAQLTDGAGRLKEGTGALRSGTDTLKGGSSQLSSGASQLSDGARALDEGAGQLKEGLGTLKEGTGTLIQGIQQLYNGSVQLNDGMKKFKTEGADKLKTELKGNLTNTYDRFKAMRKAAQNYTTYSGKTDETKGKVNFLFKTGE